MAESDSNSASSSSEDQEQNEESGIDELEVRIRPALPYQDEPVAQVAACTGEDEIYSDDEDEDGISPATLEARFENRVSVDAWKVEKVNFRIKFPLFISRSQTLVCFILHVGVYVVYVKQKPLLVHESIAAARN